MVDFRAVAGGALAGLGDGLIEEARARREEAARALQQEQRTAERLQDRAWAVEDRDLAYARSRRGRGSGGGRRSGGGSGGGTPTMNPDGSFSFAYSPDDPSAVRTNKIRAQARAMSEGRSEITPEDYLWAESSGDQVAPEARARLVQTEAAAIRDSSAAFDMSPEEIMEQATRTVDSLLAPPQAQQPQTGLLPDPVSPATLPLPQGLGSPAMQDQNDVALPAPRDPAQRQVGQVYRSPTGAMGRWTGEGWEVVDG